MASCKARRRRAKKEARANSTPADPFNIPEEMRAMLEHWDDVRLTSECLHCRGTGRAPGDGSTSCGFCELDPETADD